MALGAGARIGMAVQESVIPGETLFDPQRDLAKRARHIIVRSGRATTRYTSIGDRRSGDRTGGEVAKLVAHAREVAGREW